MGHYRFTVSQRILSQHDFQKVFKEADYRSGNKRLLLLARKTDHGNSGRIGLVIPKKHLRRAVDRNLVKRIARNTFRLRQSEFLGLDIVVLVKGKYQLSNLRIEITSDIGYLWDKLARKVDKREHN